MLRRTWLGMQLAIYHDFLREYVYYLLQSSLQYEPHVASYTYTLRCYFNRCSDKIKYTRDSGANYNCLWCLACNVSDIITAFCGNKDYVVRVLMVTHLFVLWAALVATVGSDGVKGEDLSTVDVEHPCGGSAVVERPATATVKSMVKAEDVARLLTRALHRVNDIKTTYVS